MYLHLHTISLNVFCRSTLRTWLRLGATSCKHNHFLRPARRVWPYTPTRLRCHLLYHRNNKRLLHHTSLTWFR